MTTNRSSSRNRRARRATPAAAAPEATLATVEETQRVSHQHWQEEYGYIFRDLRKLLIVSGVLFAAIIVLGFFM